MESASLGRKCEAITVTTIFELEIVPAPRGSRELSVSVYRQIRSGILEGRVRPGMRLPSTRDASSMYGISRNTVQDIYERLIHEGLIVAIHGSGTFVADRPAEGPGEPGSALDWRPANLNDVWDGNRLSSLVGGLAPSEGRPPGSRIDLRPGTVDPRLFPLATFRRMMARQLRGIEIGRWDCDELEDDRGNLELRRAIVEHVALTRAVPCRADDVVVTSGAQQAFDLIARILVKPGRTVVAVEDPGYPPLRAPFHAAGAQVVPVPVDCEGMVVDALPNEASVICVTPSHQFPLGVPLSLRRREALVRHAKSHGAVIIEDDYDGEFRYEGTPLRALRSRECADNIFYVGTFSKCMLPLMRLGFVVPPAWAMSPLMAAKKTAGARPSAPLQLATAAFVAEGHLLRHIRKIRRTYGQRRKVLIDGLGDGILSPCFEALPSNYGMHIAAFARDDVDTDAIRKELARQGVRINALDVFYIDAGGRPGLVFGFGAADAVVLNELLRLIAAIAASTGRAAHGRLAS